MIIIHNNIIPFGGYSSINLFGIVFTKKTQLNAIHKRHEAIHSKQILEIMIVAALILLGLITLCSWSYWLLLLSPLIYYIWYILEYMWVSVMHNEQNCSYHDISFEEEAHNNDKDIDYLNNRKLFAWTKYLKTESNHISNKNCRN